MEQRTTAVEAAMDDIRNIEATNLDGDGIITAAGVAAIRDRLIELAADRDLFPLDDFPPPGPDDTRTSYLYRLAQDADDRFALYAQASRGDVATPVHNHTTWAVVVGFEGSELNRFYDRTEDGITQTGEHLVEAGTGIAMRPDDLHAIQVEGRALNFHCYGLALERLDDRVYWHETERRWKPFSNVSGIREARAGQPTC